MIRIIDYYCMLIISSQAPFKRFSFSSHDNRHAFQDQGEYFGNVRRSLFYFCFNQLSRQDAFKRASFTMIIT